MWLYNFISGFLMGVAVVIIIFLIVAELRIEKKIGEKHEINDTDDIGKI